MELQVISTGSIGNCYVLWDEGKALLLDAGISIQRIMRAINFQAERVMGCLVTHEHGDHCLAVKDLNRVGISCYGTAGTAQLVEGLRSDGYVKPGIRSFDDLLVMEFQTYHDAAEPCGYLITNRRTGEKMIYATDTYTLPNRFPGLHYWLIECNYFESLIDSDTPDFLAQRLRKSHLSLERLVEVFKANDLSACKQIILCHASQGRSDKTVMAQTIYDLTKIPVHVAQAGERYKLSLGTF